MTDLLFKDERPNKGRNKKAPSDLDKAVATALRNARTASKRTGVEVARLLAISVQQLHSYETGETRITAGRLLEFCQVIEVPPEDILADAAQIIPNQDSNGVSGREIQQMLSAFRSIDNEEFRKKLIQIGTRYARQETR